MKMEESVVPAFVRFLFWVAFISCFSFGAQAAPSGKACEPLLKCQNAYNQWHQNQAMTGLTTKPGQGIQGQGGQIQQASLNAQALACQAQKTCEEGEKTCAQSCDPEKCKNIKSNAEQMLRACTEAGVTGMAGAQTQSSAQAGAPTGTNPAGSGTVDTGALTNALLMGGMMAAMTANQDKNQDQQEPQYNGALQKDGTIDCSKADAYRFSACDSHLEAQCQSSIETSACQAFSQRYCGSSGGGIGTSYCRTVMAWNFCQTSGRSLCPSCLQLQRRNSEGCTENPSLCMAQDSGSEISKARTTCPTDPIFSDPTYASAEGYTSELSTSGGDSLPAVVLPQSVSSAGGRDVAQANVGGPASDVQGQYGPSVFATSTSVIKKRCEEGRLNCR